MTVKFVFTIVAALIACLCPTGAGAAIVPADAGAYQVILDRNPFGLRPVVIPQTNDTTTAPVVQLNLKLSGISTLGPQKRVFLVTTEPGKPADYLTLVEGEKQGNIEILEINEELGTVKLRNGTITKVLDFSNDAPKGVAAPPPVAGVPGAAGAPAASPLGTPLPAPAPGANPTVSPATRSTMPVPATSPGASPATPAGNMPKRTLRLPGSPSSSYPVGPTDRTAAASLEAAVIVNETQKIINKKDIDAGNLPPLPPFPSDE